MSDSTVDQDEPDIPEYALHPLSGIVLAGFTGIPLGACIVLALNYWRTGARAAAKACVLAGLFLSVVWFALLTLPNMFERMPNELLVIPEVLVIGAIAARLQGRMISEHDRNGGQMASPLRGAQIGGSCLLVVLAVTMVASHMVEPTPGTCVAFGNDAIYYQDEATHADTWRLATLLRQLGYLQNRGDSVQIAATGGRYAVSFVFGNGSWQDAGAGDSLREIGSELAQEFGTPLTVHLCDEYLESQRSFIVERDDLEPNERQKDVPQKDSAPDADSQA